jgi:hypothetical protein
MRDVVLGHRVKLGHWMSLEGNKSPTTVRLGEGARILINVRGLTIWGLWGAHQLNTPKCRSDY